jgi:hypothetical protein
MAGSTFLNPSGMTFLAAILVLPWSAQSDLDRRWMPLFIIKGFSPLQMGDVVLGLKLFVMMKMIGTGIGKHS